MGKTKKIQKLGANQPSGTQLVAWIQLSPKNLPPIKEIHGLDTPPPQVVKVNSLLKFDEGDIPYNKHPSQCLYEFDNYIRKQDLFNANVMKQLKQNYDKIACLSDLLFRITNHVRGVGKHASMVQTQ